MKLKQCTCSFHNQTKLVVGLDTTSQRHDKVQRKIIAADRCFGMMK
jgi:hypothetical protein